MAQVLIMLCIVMALTMTVSPERGREAEAVRLTNESAAYWADVKPNEALRSALAAKQIWEELGETGRREYLVTINNVITAELLGGDLRQAEPLVTNARTLNLKLLPASDPMLPLSLTVVATAYKALGNYAEANAAAEQALEIATAQKASGSLMATLTIGVGDVLALRGRFVEAESKLREGLALAGKAADADPVTVALSYRSLGGVERQLGQYDAAEAADRKGLQLLEGQHGHADVARGQILTELGILEEQRNNWKQAEQYLRQAVRVLETTFGPNHMSISSSYSDLAGLYLQRHQYRKAEVLYKQVLATETAALPAEHPAIARDLNNLGSLEFKRRHFAKAEGLLSEALAAMERTLGPASAETGQVEANLANTLFELKRYREASQHYMRSVSTLDRCWGEDDPRLLDILRGFAAVYRNQAELAQAELLETRMERIRVKQAIARDRQQQSGRS